MDKRKTLQTNLSGILGQRRITQKELTERTALSITTINAIYHDKWEYIGRKAIERICTALDIDISELFELAKNDEAA